MININNGEIYIKELIFYKLRVPYNYLAKFVKFRNKFFILIG